MTGRVRQYVAGAVTALSVLTLLALGLLDGGPLRAVAVLVFLLVAPGWALVRFLPLGGALAFSLVVAVSLAVVSLIGLALLYLEAWVPTAATAVLAVVTLACGLHELRGLAAGRTATEVAR